MKYRRVPLVLEAHQLTKDSVSKIKEWTKQDLPWWANGYSPTNITGVYLQTLEGTVQATFGDYIVKGIDGEFYPCKPDIFARIYEEVKHD